MKMAVIGLGVVSAIFLMLLVDKSNQLNQATSEIEKLQQSTPDNKPIRNHKDPVVGSSSDQKLQEIAQFLTEMKQQINTLQQQMEKMKISSQPLITDPPKTDINNKVTSAIQALELKKVLFQELKNLDEAGETLKPEDHFQAFIEKTALFLGLSDSQKSTLGNLVSWYAQEIKKPAEDYARLMQERQEKINEISKRYNLTKEDYDKDTQKHKEMRSEIQALSDSYKELEKSAAARWKEAHKTTIEGIKALVPDSPRKSEFFKKDTVRDWFTHIVNMSKIKTPGTYYWAHQYWFSGQFDK